MNKELKLYFRDITRLLPGTARQKKQFIDTLRQSVSTYIQENSPASMQEVQTHFGTPQQITSAYLDEMSTSEVIKKIKVRKAVIRIICATVALALLMWGISLASALADEKDSADGYYDVGLIIEDQEMEENK